MIRRNYEVSRSLEVISNYSDKESTPRCLDLIRLISMKERPASPHQKNEITANDGENSKQIDPVAPDCSPMREILRNFVKRRSNNRKYLYEASYYPTIERNVERTKLQKMGNYLLGDRIGKGGCASVYVGKHAYLHPEEQVAIKVINAPQTSNEFQQFRWEAKVLSSLSHRNIVKYKDFGVYGANSAFLVMEYVPHGTLRDRHPADTPALDLELLVEYVNQIADALDYVHEQKLMHLDVKPCNILVASDGRLLLSDFGLAQIVPYLATQKTGKVAGTYGYMPPEQLKGKPRPASDQYALGVMVYKWLSGGKHPFDDPQPIGDPPQAMHLKQTDKLKDVIIRALQGNPKERYKKVTDFAKALEQAFILSKASEKICSNAILHSEEQSLSEPKRGEMISIRAAIPILC